VSFRLVLACAALSVALAAVLVHLASTAGVQAEQPRPFRPFPPRVTAEAQALPQYAPNTDVRVRQQLASVNAMWKPAFAAAGMTYTEPTLGGATGACGPRGGGWAGIYCPADGRIAIDVHGHVRRHQAVGQALADTVLGYVVAHEVGHHVQTLQGAPESRLRRELHADCLAGVWGKAAGVPLPPMWAYGEDAEHGTAAQRVKWLNDGYRSARPSDCDAIWSTSASP
jgi:uncharacterized protein